MRSVAAIRSNPLHGSVADFQHAVAVGTAWRHEAHQRRDAVPIDRAMEPLQQTQHHGPFGHGAHAR